MPPCLPGSSKSGTNAAQTVTILAVTGKKICLSHLIVCVEAAAVGASPAKVVVSDGSTAIHEVQIPASAAIGTPINHVFCSPLQGSVATAMTITCEALGASSVSVINYGYYAL
jgi:hypothetical protein